MVRCLRFVVVPVLLAISPGAFCDAKDAETGAVSEVTDGHAIVNALISDPTISERLKADGLSVGRMTRQVLQPGITEYVLYVHTCGMCNPGKAKTGFVTITENMRPTYMDGPIEYSVSFSIEPLVRKKSGE